MWAINERKNDKPPPVGYYRPNFATQDHKRLNIDFEINGEPIESKKN